MTCARGGPLRIYFPRVASRSSSATSRPDGRLNRNCRLGILASTDEIGGGGGGGMKLGDDDLGRAGRDPFSCEFRELRSGVMLMIIIL